MTAIRRSKLKSVASLIMGLGVGTAAGLTGMVMGAAPVLASQEVQATDTQDAVPNEPAGEPGSRVHIDRSGRAQTGKASFYASRYSGKTMADGTPMHLYSNNAASLTLPLGTTAHVTNLETGKSALITIRDRGPYVKGRIVDLSPATARLIGISAKMGLANVKVVPISVPGTDGALRVASLTR